jgi:hypothetical protein
VVAAIAVPTVLANDPDAGREPGPAQAPASLFATPQPAWAIGSSVHLGERTFDMGRRVEALFVTTDGIVFADDGGTVYASDGTAAPAEIGTVDLGEGHLVGDGSRAAWIDHDDGSAPVFTVYDQATGETERADYDTAGEGATEYHPSLFAIDGDDVYLRDARGVIRWELDTGEQTLLGSPNGLEIQDVKSGVIAHTLPDPVDGGVDVYAGTELGASEPLNLVSQATALNPAGTKLIGSGPGMGTIVMDTDSATNQHWQVFAYAYGELSPVAWIDDDTYSAVGSKPMTGPARQDLLTCDVGDGNCTVVATDFAKKSEHVTYSVGFAGPGS